MIGVIIADLIKLRGSLVLLVMAVQPVMMAVLGVLVIISGNSAGDWPRTALSGTAIWAYFLLPMTATGLTALLAQLEHSTGVWSHILATGTPRWQIFLSKGLIAFALMGTTSLLVGLAIFASGHVGGILVSTEALEGVPPYGQVVAILAKMWVAGLLVTAFQLAIALRFSSFALPVSVGIGGTFVAVAATSSKWGLVFPWLMPVNVLASEPERALLAITIGGIGGLAALAAMIVWLSRKDWG